jgi:nucleoside-diphosphate-sugar epimerase
MFGPESKVPRRHCIDAETPEAFDAILKESHPDIVFHCASLFLAEHKPDQIPALIASNIGFGTGLVDAMVHHGVLKLVNAGTSWQHFSVDQYRPVNLYAATKQAFEDILAYYVDAYGLEAITLKLFDTYGPDDPRPKLVPLLQRTALTGDPLEMSQGEQLLDLLHVDDAIEGFCIAADRLLVAKKALGFHETYGLSSKRLVSIRELVGLFSKLGGAPLKVTWGKRPYRKREIMIPWKPPTSLPGWKPGISLEKGIADLLRT